MWRTSVGAVWVLVALSAPAIAQQQLQGPEVSAKAYEITDEYRLPKGAGTFRVEGSRLYDSWFLTTGSLEFEPGSELVFSENAVSRGNLFILAQSIVSLDPERPGRISFVRNVPQLPGDRGTAPAGEDKGGVEGETGGSGQNGESGQRGFMGVGGPNLTVVVEDLTTPLVVDLKGGAGGPGGKGQDGGRGGGGGYGNPASATMIGCKRGAGDGATGGRGGNGGVGGIGGSGGPGGTLTLITDTARYALTTAAVRLDVSGGEGGAPGNGGDSGRGGPGGRKGSPALPYCKDDGNNGNPGASGSGGPRGDSGATGSPGSYYAGSLSTADLTRVIRAESPP